ncbi:unnamed protein product [Kuraishia capsulata CBS 1993]|uniref:TEL2-interacting protein 1 n=1 Tax=Kuraishia capsulata CBS 1993 TaxID=1382522 RepID=W6MSU0_9ASCO|nr:uncharacterized protein KUCA_T00005885001 [Kuraishia capsulata CBS 1993]CDK29891.1 unnamed protein product [Kuraishia capsulata CBS 1993]
MSDIREASQVAFQEIRQPCVALSNIVFSKTSPLDPRSKELSDAVSQVYTSFAQVVSSLEKQHGEVYLTTTLADYVFVPLVDLFKAPQIGDRTLEKLLKILATLIRCCWRIAGSLPSQLGTNLLSLLSFLIGGPPSGQTRQKPSRSNEVIEADLECLKELFISIRTQTSAGIPNLLEDASTLPSFGYTVSVILDSLRDCQDVKVQIRALEALDVICDLFPKGDMLSMILPGCMSTFVKVVAQRNGVKVHYTALEAIIRLVTKILVFTCSDNNLGAFVKDFNLNSLEDLKDSSSELLKNHDTIEFIPEEKDHRTKEWLVKTSSQIDVAFNTILKLRNHDKQIVVEAIVELCGTLMARCHYSLNSLIPKLLDTLGKIYSKDEGNDYKTLETVVKTPNLEGFVLKRLDQWIGSLSAAFLFTDQERTYGIIKLISFACEIIKSWALTGTTSKTSITVLMQRLLITIQESLSNLVSRKKDSKPSITSIPQSIGTDMLITTQGYDGGDIDDISHQKPLFDGLLDSKCEDGLYLLLNLVTQLDPTLKVPEPTISESQSSKPVLLWMMRGLLCGAQIKPNALQDENWMFNDDEENHDVLVQERVYDLLEASGSLLSECLTEEASDSVARAQVASLKSIADACQYLGPDFQYELIDYLYPVVDCLTSPIEHVRYEAQRTTFQIAKICYDGSVKSLIFENYDYLIDSLSLNLTGHSITPRTPIVLMVLIKFGGKEILYQLSDVISTMFALLDMYHGYAVLCESFFSVFHEFVESVEKSYLEDYEFVKPDAEGDILRPWGMKTFDDLVKFLTHERDIPEMNDLTLEEVLDKPDSDDDDEEEEENTAESSPPQSEETTPWQSPIPKQLYFKIQQIWNYADRLSTHSSLRLRVLILTIMTRIVRLLSSSPHDFLPNLASSWHLVSSFILDVDKAKGTTPDPRLVILASDLGCQFLHYGGGFLTHRMLQFWSGLKTKQWFLDGTRALRHPKAHSAMDLYLQAMVAVSRFLFCSIQNLGVQIPENVAYEMIHMACIWVEKDPEKYGYFADTATLVQLENTTAIE